MVNSWQRAEQQKHGILGMMNGVHFTKQQAAEIKAFLDAHTESSLDDYLNVRACAEGKVPGVYQINVPQLPPGATFTLKIGGDQ